MLDAGKSLCSLLKMVFNTYPLEAATTPHDVKILYQRVADLIQKNLAATVPQISLEAGSNNSMISFSLFIVRTLTEVQRTLIDPFIGPMVRVLQRLARDSSSSTGTQIKQVCYFNNSHALLFPIPAAIAKYFSL